MTLFRFVNLLARLSQDRLGRSVAEHFFVFLGDLLPYGLLFVLTILIGFRFGLEAAGTFSLLYAYVATVTALVAGPNLLSIRRRMPTTGSAGAVVVAALVLRVTLIGTSALTAMTVAALLDIEPTMISITGLLFMGRLLEVCIDAPATCIQYLRPARVYFLFRLGLFVLELTILSLGFALIESTQQLAVVKQVALWYLTATALALFMGIAFVRRLFGPWNRILAAIVNELRDQILEFARFFVASAFFVAASRIHPVLILAVAGVVAAERFATIFNIFSALSMTATGIAGVYFWSRNRLMRDHKRDGLPTCWLIGAILGGLLLGAIGGLAIQELFLRPLNAPEDMRIGAWLLCMAMPVLITQSIVSNMLVLQKRDHEMLLVSILNATLSIGVIAICVKMAGLIGASISVGLSATIATLIGIYAVRRAQ